MSKKATVTRGMIADAAFEIARTEGYECVNTRSIAKKIGCTTQPVLYHFSSMAEIKAEVCRMADSFHSEYLNPASEDCPDLMLGIALRYVSFAAEERHLFRLLFQTDQFADKDLGGLTGDSANIITGILSAREGVSEETAREIFDCIFFPVHGIASLVANNAMTYDEEYVSGIMEKIYISVTDKIKEEHNNE